MDTQASIPKTIHYCWFGKNPKPKLVQECIASWKKHLPGFSIKEWNESNYDVSKHPFTARMYKEKKWAFVSDYARLEILSSHGGIYLDTDMEIVKDISPLLSCELLLGKETNETISAGMIGAIPHHPYIVACKEKYNNVHATPPTIPRLITGVYNDMKERLTNTIVCEPIAFYPYSPETIASYKKSDLTPGTYGVHLWNYSWGHPALRFLNQFSLYHASKRLLTALGLKSAIKKLLRLS